MMMMIKLKTKQMHTPYGFTLLVIFVEQTNTSVSLFDKDIFNNLNFF